MCNFVSVFRKKTIGMDKRRCIYLLAGGFGALLLVAAAVLFIVTRPVNTSGEEMCLYVDADDNADSVRVKLGQPAGWRLLAATGYHVHTGRYVVPHGDRLHTVFRRLRGGQQDPMELQIPSVRTLPKLASYLSHKLMLDSASIASSFADTAFCHTLGFTPQTLPALFVPNTYEVYWDTSLPTLMRRLQSEHNHFWEGKRNTLAQSIGLTPVEVCTLASIVDEETAANAEKPMVAGMYVNRLHIGMPLQADPTVKFAIGDFSLRRIYHNHLKTESPYNTYIHPGLPPGPIRIASIAGIDAVLGYVHHDYLYMCAKEDFSGTHNFARTYAEHLNNARRYAKALNTRNIR